MITIKLVGLGNLIEVVVPEGSTLREVIAEMREQGLIDSLDRLEVRLNGQKADQTAAVNGGDVVTAVPNMKAGI